MAWKNTKRRKKRFVFRKISWNASRVCAITNSRKAHIFKKPNLVRSFWFQRFLNVLILGGKKLTAYKFAFRALALLKANHGRSPLLLVFEILELYRTPVYALPGGRGARKGYTRVHIITWWKQYSLVLRWFRQSLYTSRRVVTAWDVRILSELELLLSFNQQSTVFKKRALNIQLAAYGRTSEHFRW